MMTVQILQSVSWRQIQHLLTYDLDRVIFFDAWSVLQRPMRGGRSLLWICTYFLPSLGRRNEVVTGRPTFLRT